MTWSEIIILLDGVELGRTDAEGIAKGYEQRLWDQSVLRIWLERGPRNTPFLYLTRNGHPLPGSEGDPVKILWMTLGIIWVIAVIQIAFPLMAITHDRGDSVMVWALILGCILVVLGIMAWHRSLPAMIAACALCFGEVMVFLAAQAQLNIGNVLRLIFGGVLFGWLLMRGINAVRTLKAIALPIRHPPEPAHRSNDHAESQAR